MNKSNDYTLCLESLPSSWEKCRFKNVFRSSKEIVGKKAPEYDRLALTLKGVVRRPKNDDNGLQPKDFETYQILNTGDMVFKMIDLQNVNTSRVGQTPWTGIVSPAYLRFEPILKDTGFMYYYFINLYYNNVFNNIAGDGVRSALNSSDIGNIWCPFPSFDEQVKIVIALNKKISQIDSLIANQEKQIEKLEEYRQAVITKVVTKGLNPNAKMKDSGVEWIGSVPSSWSVNRAKYYFISLSKGAGISKEDIHMDGDIQCIRYGEIYSKYDISAYTTYSKTYENSISSKVYLDYGDLLFSATGELVEEIGKNIVYLGREKCLAGGDIIVGKHQQNPRFLNYSLYCSASQAQKSLGKAKLKVVHISSTNIGNVVIAVPSLEEQEKIADFLDLKCCKIKSVINLKRKKIDYLKSVKKSIIYEYVTGKKRVNS